MKQYIGETAMALSAVLLIGTSSAPSLNSVFAQEESGSVTESVETSVESTATTESSESVTSTEGQDQMTMQHDDEGRLPGGIKIEREPTYQVGDPVVSNATHMPGMEGAEAQIVAAFDTVAYEISYEPTDGSEPVSNHRWVVHEEIAEAQENEEPQPFEVGQQVTLEAYHMPGMEGATATIDAVSEQTVYMIDYVDTETGETVMNHKWVTEDELSASGETVAPVAEESTTDESATEESEATSEESSAVESEVSSEESSSAESEESGASSSEVSEPSSTPTSQESTSEETPSSDSAE